MLSARTLDNHECFVSIAAREMLKSGDWVIPTLNGQLRINKTPLCYWLVASLAKITGKVDEFTARFPNAIFAFLSAAAILYFVNQWLSFRIAVVSTGVWVTSLSYIRYSHSARPEMALTFFVMLCLLSFYSAFTTKSRKRQVIYMLVFWISFSLANLAKGPAPLAYVLIPIFFYVAISRQWKVLIRLLPVAGPIIFLVIVLPWPLAIANRVNWDITIWKREFFDRLYGDYEPGHFPIYYYLVMMFKYITPWVAFLPMALSAHFFRVWGKAQPLMRFLWLWFVADMVFLTVDVCKRQHYILPLMPAMAILIGILLEDMAFARKAYTQKFARSVLKGHIIAIIAGAVGGSVYLAIARPQFRGHIFGIIVGDVVEPAYVATSRAQFLTFAVALGIVMIVATLTVAILFSRGKPAAACGAIFAGIIVWVMIFNAGFSTVLDVDRYTRDFAKKVAGIVLPPDKLVAYGAVSSRFVQYFGKVVPEIQDKSLLYEHYEQGDWVVCTSDYLKELILDNQLRKVYYEERYHGGKEDSGGALFHKSEKVEDDIPKPAG